MSSSDRAGFFTLGILPRDYDLPHPHLGLPVILIIRRVLIRAFELLREEDFDLTAAKEDEVTSALRSTIENRLLQNEKEVPGFNKRSFRTVGRGGQWANFNGMSLTKTPDLFFKLRNDESGPRRVIPEYDGLFIEAKPVDSKHAAGSRYCDDGLIRFVRGDYAWAMQEGMMLAYVRDDRTIAGHLIPAMDKRKDSLNTINDLQASKATGAAACAEAEAVHTSIHKRNFPWRDGKGRATDITVYHLWHSCSA